MSARALPLARALAARGHQCQVLVPPWSCPEDSGRSWDDAGVLVQNIGLPPPYPFIGHALITGRLLSAVLRHGACVVHCFKPKGYSGLVARLIWHLAALSRHAPRLIMDADDWEGRGGWNEIEPYPRWQKAIFERQEKWGLCHCHGLTVASNALETLAWGLGAPPDKVHYLPNGPSQAPLQPWKRAESRQMVLSRHQLGDVPLLLLYTRFFDFQPERLVAALGRIFAQSIRAHLLVVGTGLHGEERDFARLCQAQGIAQRVRLAGWVREEELPSYLAASDIALFPSDDTLINRTRCSVKLADLLAAGLPTIAEAVDENTTYITHEQTGLLVSPGDAQGLATGVLRLLREPGLATALGQRAAQLMRTRFGWDNLAHQAETVYQKVLEDQRLRRS